MSSNNKISSLIPSQLPEFVKSDHPNFVAFLEAYYEYLEQSNTTIQYGKTVERTKNMLNYVDIDTTLDAFATKTYNEFLNLFPKDTLADKKLIVKGIKDFYRARGTEKSYRFLFRVLFDEEPDFYYPKNDILVASSGTWFLENSLRVVGIKVNGTQNDTYANLQLFTGTQITGSVSQAIATVERVLVTYEQGEQIFEVFITVQYGTFVNNEVISSTDLNGNVLSATILSGQIKTVTVTTPGAGYSIGDPLVFESNTGTGGQAIVSSVTTGSVASVIVNKGGSGFRVNDLILFTGGGGTGANAYVSQVFADGSYHANTYNINSDVISTYANTVIGAYSNGSGGNANTSMISTLSYFVFGPTGPMTIITVNNGGNNYISVPTADVIGNTRIKNLGIIGTLNINSPGANYAINDRVTFSNPPGSFGYGAIGNVTALGPSNGISKITLSSLNGFLPGGAGYDPLNLPTVSITTANGSGANVTVATLLGYGAPMSDLSANTTTVGVIQSITILNKGSNYLTPPTINLKASGDGTARANATVSTGVFTYPGRYLDDTGFPSSYNFLQDRDYYQNYAYVVKVRRSIEDYRNYIKNILSPAGMKIWGQYEFTNETPFTETKVVYANSSQYQDTIYNANAVSFLAANTFLYANTVPGNANLSSQGTFSIWIRGNTFPTTNTDETYLYTSGNSNTDIKFAVSLANNVISSNNFGNYVKIVGRNLNGNTVLDLRSNTSGTLRPNDWVHIISSWDLVNGNSHVYISNVASKNVVTFTASGVINHNVAFTSVGAKFLGSNRYDGAMAELWYDDTYIDLSNVTNRSKFISSHFIPVNLGPTGNTPTGTAPIQYLNKANVAFANSSSNPSNNLAISGALAIANTAPSDT